VIGVQGDGEPGHEEAIEVGTVIWIGIAAIVVIAVVIAAIGKPGDGHGGTRNAATHRSRSRVGSSRGYGGTGAYGGGHAASTWGGDSGSCGDSSGGGFGGGGGSC
jgi:hypothetical protein